MEVVRGPLSVLPNVQVGLSEHGQIWHGKEGISTTHTEGPFSRDIVEVNHPRIQEDMLWIGLIPAPTQVLLLNTYVSFVLLIFRVFHFHIINAPTSEV